MLNEYLIGMPKYSLLYLVAICAFSGCSLFSDSKKWNGGKIGDYGDYNYQPGEFNLKLSADSSILTYTGSIGKFTINSAGDRASVLQRWTLFYDTNKRNLWINSSDIGIFVWTYDSSVNRYKKISITDTSSYYINQIPGEFFSDFSDVEKKIMIKNGYSQKNTLQ